MREFDALWRYPQRSAPRNVSERTFACRLIAERRGREFFDGDRKHGYGGLMDDGRWAAVAEDMMREYGLKLGSTVLQLQAEKGFLLREFERRGCQAVGTETTEYMDDAVMPLRKMRPWEIGRLHGIFDLVIALGAVYTLALGDAVTCLREIQRAGRRAFITLAAYDTEEDYWLLRCWSLLGTTILTRQHWLEVLAEAGYDGDFKFVTAESLNLTWGALGA